MLSNFSKHWKTTVAGWGLAALQVVLNGRSPKAIIVAVIAAILGSVSKDPNAVN